MNRHSRASLQREKFMSDRSLFFYLFARPGDEGKSNLTVVVVVIG